MTPLSEGVYRVYLRDHGRLEGKLDENTLRKTITTVHRARLQQQHVLFREKLIELIGDETMAV